jgi:hypothetical protein
MLPMSTVLNEYLTKKDTDVIIDYNDMLIKIIGAISELKNNMYVQNSLVNQQLPINNSVADNIENKNEIVNKINPIPIPTIAHNFNNNYGLNNTDNMVVKNLQITTDHYITRDPTLMEKNISYMSNEMSTNMMNIDNVVRAVQQKENNNKDKKMQNSPKNESEKNSPKLVQNDSIKLDERKDVKNMKIFDDNDSFEKTSDDDNENNDNVDMDVKDNFSDMNTINNQLNQHINELSNKENIVDENLDDIDNNIENAINDSIAIDNKKNDTNDSFNNASLLADQVLSETSQSNYVDVYNNSKPLQPYVKQKGGKNSPKRKTKITKI